MELKENYRRACHIRRIKTKYNTTTLRQRQDAYELMTPILYLHRVTSTRK